LVGVSAARADTGGSHAVRGSSALATSIAGMPTTSTAALLSGTRVMNYYPARQNWANMWTNWDPVTINADFGRIAALRANVVRVILQAWTIGYPVPQPMMLSHLAQMIALAQQHGLRVQLTLFDWWNSYTDLVGSERWASTVLAPYVRDPRIAFIELQNEIDPRNSAAMAWARQMLPYVRAVAGGIPVTVSVSSQYGVGGLHALMVALRAALPDFADYHYFDAAELAYSAFQQAAQAVAPLPLFIGETGFSSALSNATVWDLPSTTPAMEAYQDYYYRVVQHAASALGLPTVAPWTLTDFTPGSIAWTAPTSPEYGFGLYRVDGSAKPIAASVTSALVTGSVSTSFNEGFETCAGSTPALWLLFHHTQAQFACDTTVAHSGHASARISASGGDSSGVPAFYLSPPVAGLAPGRVYSATVWARGQNLTGTTQIALAWFDANNTYLGTTASVALPTGTTNWTLLTASGSAPPGSAYAQIHLKSAYNAGTAWFDDVTFQ
jgi:hypothetical protein